MPEITKNERVVNLVKKNFVREVWECSAAVH